MKYNYYKDDSGNNLKEFLALNRTQLANESTYLSFKRTSISFTVAALTLYKLLGGTMGILVALILIISAIYFFIRGRIIYRSLLVSLEEEANNLLKNKNPNTGINN